jgi:hypothetical protein
MQYLITAFCASSPYSSFSFFPSMKRRWFEVPWDFQRLDCPLQSEVNLLLLLWLHYPRMISPSLLSVFHPPTSCAACPHLRMRSFLKRDRYLEPNMKKWMNDERINVMLQFVVIFFVQCGDGYVSDSLTMTIHISVLLNDFLGAFAKLLKATTSFVVSVLLSVRLHRTTWLPLGRLSWNLIFVYFSKICQVN